MSNIYFISVGNFLCWVEIKIFFLLWVALYLSGLPFQLFMTGELQTCS